MPKSNKARQILASLKLGEISAVDNPAQEPALIAITKRSSGGNVTDENLQQRLDALEKELGVFKEIAGLPGDQKNYYDSLDSDGDRQEFMKMNADERSELAKPKNPEVVYKASDETVYTVDDDPRLVSLAKSADASAKAAAKATQEAFESEVKKRAAQLIPNLGKSDNVRYALLKSVMSIEEEAIRNEAIAVLKQCNGQYATAMTRVAAGWDENEEVSKSDKDENSLLSICKRGF